MPTRSLNAALDALGATLPMSLGSTVLLYTLVAPAYLGPGVLALLLGLAWVHLLTAHSARPVFHGARFFEAATVAAMVLEAASQLAELGLPDTPGTRIALLTSLLALAAVVVGLLWAMQAQRFARFIPAPVYVGFANTISVAIVLSQVPALWRQAAAFPLPWLPWLLAAAVLASTLATRVCKPLWPATTVGLLAGLVLGLATDAAGTPLPKVLTAGDWTLPLMQADYLSFLLHPEAALRMGGLMVLNAIVIGTLMFLNTVVMGQMLSQSDDREPHPRRDGWRQTLGLLLAGGLGAAPISGAPPPSLAAARHGPVEAHSLVLLAGLALGVALSQVLVWMPLAAISGIMFFDAWVLWDRPSTRDAWRWLRHRRVSPQAREDGILIASVMAASLLVNMMAGLLTGLVLGLLLHALRSTRQPVRNLWTGEQLASQCARSREELQVLTEHGRDIRIFQLDSQQFFASAAQLNRTVREHSLGALGVVIDWSRVEHIDSSVAMTIGRLTAHLRQQGVTVWHADTRRHGEEPQATLAQHLDQALWAADLDRALEQAENLLVQRHNPALAFPMEDSTEPPWVEGLDAGQRRALAQHLRTRSFAPGERILVAGAPSDEMWLIVRGRCSVYLHHGTDQETRLAGVRHGTTVGEMGFLDGAPRSATVVADTEVQAWCLTRAAFQALSAEAPGVVQQILTRLTTDLSTRLRFAHRQPPSH